MPVSITPSGWYPDPGQTPGAPPRERWWDGTSWTDYIRSAPSPAPDQIQHPGFPAQQPSPGGGGRRSVVVGAVAGAVLLVGGVITGLVLLGDDDEDRGQARPSASATTTPSPGADDPGSATPGTGQPSTGQPGSPSRQPNPGTAVVDARLGVSLPLPQGWQQQNTSPEGGAYISTDPYPCEGASTGICVSAGVYTLPGSGTDPKAAAEQDIAENAKSSYGERNGHDQVKAEEVTVAGRPGYLVRWKVDVAEGPDGYVQSVAFASPASNRMVLVRFGFDDTPEAPGLTLMDQILSGIRAAGPPNGV